MSDDLVNQITLNFLISKQQMQKLNKKIKQKEEDKMKTDMEIYREQIVELFTKFINDEFPDDLLEDVKHSYTYFIEKSIYYLKMHSDLTIEATNESLTVDTNLEEDLEEDDEDISDTVASLDEDDLIMNMPLHKMNDAQIEKYVELRGCCPRDEIYEWAMVYNGGDIIRYSYCNFSQWHIEDQTVSNITITHAIFEQTTFTKYVFDNVTFDECVFKDVILNNTTFKNSKFIDCEFDSSIVPDKSCEVVNYIDDDDDHIHITYY